MPRLRADVLLAVSVPLLLLGGMLPWHVDQVCTVDGCVPVHASAWSGSPAWAVPLILALAVAGGWLLLLPVRAVPTGLAALAAAIGSLGAMVVLVSLDALVFSRPGLLPYRLPVREEFPVLSVRPGSGLAVGLLGLLGVAAAGWLTVRARHALVTPWRPPRRPGAPAPGGHGPAPRPAPGAGPGSGPGAAPGAAPRPGPGAAPDAYGPAPDREPWQPTALRQGPPPPRSRRARHR